MWMDDVGIVIVDAQILIPFDVETMVLESLWDQPHDGCNCRLPWRADVNAEFLVLRLLGPSLSIHVRAIGFDLGKVD